MKGYRRFKPQQRRVAYFTIEMGLEPEIPTYSGGLGILAGDTVKTFADLKYPAVAVTLLNEKGYFYQDLEKDGNQREAPVDWDFKSQLQPIPEKVTVNLEGRDIIVQGWVKPVEGVAGDVVPVIFLDTNLEANNMLDRGLTSQLYGGDLRYRLMQEAILGVGGARLLQVLDHDNLGSYHMNEGHSALLTLELMDRYEGDLERVRRLCVFTTHTPIAAGHDTFDLELAKAVLGEMFDVESLKHDNIVDERNLLNMTYLALYHSGFINAVGKMHGEVTKRMFPHYDINAITNGVHPNTWVSEHMAKVFDRYIPQWRTDPYTLRNALRIPKKKLCGAHHKAKKELIDFINHHYKSGFEYDALTMGFARRAATYKRADLLFQDTQRLKDIVSREGKLQVIYGGKAHPQDEGGKQLIRKVFKHFKEVEDKIKVVYMKNYEIFTAKLLVAGADLWLNTPKKPMEASGTSGMKAALNGVINFSVLDGWWLEGYVKDYTGYSIGSPTREETADEEDADDLYTKLEGDILPTYYGNRRKWEEMMVQNIALNGSFFHTHRMVSQYVIQAYSR
ncbi:MAG: alpha-glucan family phosphorylase [Candidatus Altiarchaeales archaeon]|nr:alpha-glucan family phosphorylase [Candidatus Altiarchaeales archaeon]MBD3416800.1 alpha-glucan family phosphorylase [Candidatus Altiarchaeales archaeon]